MTRNWSWNPQRRSVSFGTRKRRLLYNGKKTNVEGTGQNGHGEGPDDYADAYLETLSTTMPISVLASLFVVGPLTKLIFNNRVKPADGLRVLKTLSDHACSFARVFGF